jgi:hypothetical protein
MDILRNWIFNLTAEHVLRAQGSDPFIIRDRKPKLYEIAEWAVREGLPLLDPKVIQKTYRVRRLVHQKLELQANNGNKPYFLTGALIAEHLAAAEITIMVCTIGDTLEQLAAELMSTDPLLGWAMDSLGSAAVESLATQACNQVESRAEKQGLRSTISLSPGMVGWPVERGQTELFKLIDTSTIGVRLNKHYQMQPAKTLSLVIGTGRDISIQGKTCDYCAMNTTCQYQNHFI